MADMLPVVADTHFSRLCAVDDYTSFIWTTRYYDVGDFQLTIPMSSHNLRYLQVNNYVMRGDNDSEMGIIERREITEDLNGQETLTVSGRFLASILARRIISQQTQVSGTIAQCVQHLLSECAVAPRDTARRLPIVFGTFDIPSTQMEQQFTGKGLLDVISTIAKANSIGFDMRYDRDTGNMIFNMFAGVDRSYAQDVNTYAVFSSEYGNLQSSDYVEDVSTTVTNVLVAGEGEGINRKTVWVTESNPTGLARYELYQDARNASTNDGAISDKVYYQQLRDEGAESLADMAQIFAGKVSFANIDYGTDLYVGDICTIESVSWGMYMNARLIEVIESVDESGAYSVTPSFEAVSLADVPTDAAMVTETGNVAIMSESGARLLAQVRAISATGGEVKISELEEATTLSDDDAFPMATSSATLKATWALMAREMLGRVYPVGSIYINATNDTNPATLLGFGEWQRLSQGRMMIDANSTYAAGATGGEATHVLTKAELPNLAGTVQFHGAGTSSGTVLSKTSGVFGQGTKRNNYKNGGNTGAATSYDGFTLNVGNNTAHNNMPPWIGVYIWKRTA